MKTRIARTPSILARRAVRGLVLALVVLAVAVAGCNENTPTPTSIAATIAPITATPSAVATSAASGALTLFETPRDGPAPVVDAIKSATRAVDVEVYELGDTGVINALIADQQAGRQVRVLLNENFFSGGKHNAAVLQQLQAAGVAAKYANPAYTYTHEKSIIVDPGQGSQKVLIMTLNLQPGYMGEPDPQGTSLNFGVVDPNAADIAQAEAIFNADWNDQSYTPPADTPLVISPVNARQKLLAEIQGATRSIHFFAQEFEDTQIVDAVVAAAQRGIEVKGLLAPGIAANTKTGHAVRSAGGQIRVLSKPYEHAKATIVDGSLVYIGSINYTATSMDKNRELGILTRQSDIASQMESEFSRFWGQASDLPRSSFDSIKNGSGEMKKTYLKTRKGICKVIFTLPKDLGAQTAFLVGEFNNWDRNATPMKRNRNGSFSVALNLEVGKAYRFRYWLDDTHWENDWDADRYVPNGFGSDDSVVNA